MRSVRGIYDDNENLLMLTTLTKHRPMMGALYLVGVVTGLRISDLLSLRAGQIAPEFAVIEGKTGKSRTLRIAPPELEYLWEYIDFAKLRPDDLLFPVSRQTVFRYFKRAAADLRLEGPIGPHSMRKTYGWNVLRKSGCVLTVKRAYSHRFLSTTVLYLAQGLQWAVKRIYGPMNDPIIPPSMPDE